MGLSPWSGSWWGALLLPGETEGVARIPHPAPWQGQAPTAARTLPASPEMAPHMAGHCHLPRERQPQACWSTLGIIRFSGLELLSTGPLLSIESEMMSSHLHVVNFSLLSFLSLRFVNFIDLTEPDSGF